MKVLDDLQTELDVLFGLKKEDGSLREHMTLYDLYRKYTGDRSATGAFNPMGLSHELRSSQAIDLASFPNALANTLNRFLSAGYNKTNYFEKILISQQSPATHFHEATFVQLGNWEDLPDIDPETEDFPDMPNLADATEAFAILQKGCVIPISRKVVKNDDIDLLKKLLVKLGLVTRKTHARYVWNKWIDNDNCNDGTPWFSVTHGNLGSDAIDNIVTGIAAVITAITALANMQEPGPSTDKVGLDLSNFKWHLIAPVSKWDKAVKINQLDSYYTANDLSTKTCNPCRHLFGANNERIATPPFLSGSDWGVVRDPSEVPIVEMQYIEGKTEPDIYFEQDPHSDRAIATDFFGLKVRHEYGGTISDYRGGYKSTP